MDNLIQQISDALERIFRHVLPGACILIGAWISHPSWFPANLDKPGEWIVLTVVAVCVGNVWYVLHRFTLHQLIDVATFRITRNGKHKYHDWLIGHVSKAFLLQEERPELASVIGIRAAQIIFMFIVAEIAFAATISPDCTSCLSRGCMRATVRIVALIICGFAFWQYIISFKVDRILVEKFAPDLE